MLKKRIMITPTILAFFATVLGAIAAVWAQNEQERESKKLIKAQEEIIRLTKEGKDAVTGGDGYCILNFHPISGGKAEVTIISDSKFPLYDIEVKMYRWIPLEDIYFNNVPQNLIDNYKNSIDYNEKYFFEVKTMPAMEGQAVASKELGVVPYRAIGTEYYTIDFSARNGAWRQVWEAERRQNKKDRVSQITYKKMIKDDKVQTIIKHKFIDPHSQDSFLNDVIMEWKLQGN